MRKGLNRNMLKIVPATSVVLFSLMAAFAGSIAWFNATQALNQGTEQIPVDRLTSVLSRISFHAQVGTKTVTENGDPVKYYLFDQDEYAYITIDSTNTPSALTFNTNSGAYKDWEAKADRTSTLSTYSLLSQDHPILMLFDIVPYSAQSPSTIKLDFKTDSTYLGFANTISNTGNPLSSIVEFNAFGLTSPLPSGGSYESATQSYTDTYLYGIERQISYDKKWVAITGGESATFDADGRITLFSNLDNQGNPASTVYTQVGVVMNYSIDSLEYIYNRFLGNSVLENNLFFTWDWVMEI